LVGWETRIALPRIAKRKGLTVDPTTSRNRSITERWFRDKRDLGLRWLELVIEIGWVIAVFGDWMKATWFTEAPKGDWEAIRKGIIEKRLWIREKAREILGADYEWMMSAQICMSPPRFEVTSR